MSYRRGDESGDGHDRAEGEDGGERGERERCGRHGGIRSAYAAGRRKCFPAGRAGLLGARSNRSSM